MRSCNAYCRKKMDTVTRVQILDELVCISHSANTNEKVMNPPIPKTPVSYGENSRADWGL